MTFSTIEKSVDNAKPARLYLFTCGALFNASLTDAAVSITRNNRTYTPEAISDDGIRQTGEASAEALTVSVPATAAIVAFLRKPRSSEIALAIFDTHHGQIDAPAVWVGQIAGLSMNDEGIAKITCESLAASMSGVGLRLSWERSCPHTIYDNACLAVKSRFYVSAAVSSLDGLNVNLSLGNSTAYVGGIVEWTDNESGELLRRGITGASGSTISLLGGTSGLTVGAAVKCYLGCDQLMQTCHDRFNNSINYGGFRHMPGKSPFSGDPAF